METSYVVPSERFARCIASSKRVRWDIETDVIRGRRFDRANKLLPDGLSFANRLDFLSPDEKIYFSQVQGRTYANMFRLVERFIGAKVLELSRDHWLGDQVALEALVRFTDEELKHQALFRRVEALTAEVMPPGYSFAWDPNEVAAAVLSKGSWAVLALTLHIELFTQSHYRESIREDYLAPAEHRIGVKADGAPAGALCTWKFLTDGNDATAVVKKDRPCGDEVFDRAAYGKTKSVQLFVATPENGAPTATADVKVRDILLVGLGDSTAAGEGNPDRPVGLADNGFCFGRFFTGDAYAYYRPNRAGYTGNRSCADPNNPDDATNWAKGRAH